MFAEVEVGGKLTDLFYPRWYSLKYFIGLNDCTFEVGMKSEDGVFNYPLYILVGGNWEKTELLSLVEVTSFLKNDSGFIFKVFPTFPQFTTLPPFVYSENTSAPSLAGGLLNNAVL